MLIVPRDSGLPGDEALLKTEVTKTIGEVELRQVDEAILRTVFIFGVTSWVSHMAQCLVTKTTTRYMYNTLVSDCVKGQVSYSAVSPWSMTCCNICYLCVWCYIKASHVVECWVIMTVTCYNTSLPS